MDNKQIFAYETIMRMEEFRRKVNSLEIDEIEVWEEGERIEVDQKIIDKWKFIGLNTWDFITMRFWENGKVSE